MGNVRVITKADFISSLEDEIRNVFPESELYDDYSVSETIVERCVAGLFLSDTLEITDEYDDDDPNCFVENEIDQRSPIWDSSLESQFIDVLTDAAEYAGENFDSGICYNSDIIRVWNYDTYGEVDEMISDCYVWGPDSTLMDAMATGVTALVHQRATMNCEHVADSVDDIVSAVMDSFETVE